MLNTATLKIISPRRDNAQATDLSGIVFRTQKAIGGLLIEHMPTDEASTKSQLIEHLGLSFKSKRICKLCEDGIGTPRHYVMACTETQQYT